MSKEEIDGTERDRTTVAVRFALAELDGQPIDTAVRRLRAAAEGLAFPRFMAHQSPHNLVSDLRIGVIGTRPATAEEQEQARVKAERDAEEERDWRTYEALQRKHGWH